MQGVRIAFVALQIPSPDGIDLHITIARRYDVIDADIRAMQHDLERLIRPHLPIRVNYGNFCYLGEKNTFPAYKVEISDPLIQSLLQRYHDQNYKEAPGKAMYPKLKFHVTVDTPEKRDFYEAQMRNGSGHVIIRDTLFRTTTKGVEQIVSNGQWKCADCGTSNSMEQKECQSAHCDQWRPNVARPGDWNCQSCKYSNFASRPQCGKCGTNKQNAYEQPPSAPPAPPVHRKKPDWHCPMCNFKIFGSKPSCQKCGTMNPN